MKVLLTYSSLTGNTKTVAEAIFEVMPKGTEFFSIEEAPSPEGYDLVVLGFWVDRENADKKAQEYMNKIKNKKVALFGTLGAYPDSEHAIKTMKNARSIIENSNEVIGEFMCQGKVDPRLVERFSNLPADHPHGMTEERKVRLEEASKHPNKDDLMKAQSFIKNTLDNL